MSNCDPITIKPLTEEDFSDWLPLWKAYQVFYEADIPDDVTKVTWNRFHEPAEPMFALGAYLSDKLVGIVHYIYHRSCWSSGNYCYLQHLFTEKKTRAKGVGTALIDAVHKCAADAGANRVYWLTQEDNMTARKLYDKVASNTGFIQYKNML